MSVCVCVFYRYSIKLNKLIVYCCIGSLLTRCVNMDEKKFQFRVQEWFRQAAARYRNQTQKDNIENTILLELDRNVNVAELADLIQGNPSVLENEEQLNQ